MIRLYVVITNDESECKTRIFDDAAIATRYFEQFCYDAQFDKGYTNAVVIETNDIEKLEITNNFEHSDYAVDNGEVIRYFQYDGFESLT